MESEPITPRYFEGGKLEGFLKRRELTKREKNLFGLLGGSVLMADAVNTPYFADSILYISEIGTCFLMAGMEILAGIVLDECSTSFFENYAHASGTLSDEEGSRKGFCHILMGIPEFLRGYFDFGSCIPKLMKGTDSEK